MAIWQFEVALQPNESVADRPMAGGQHPGAGPGHRFLHADEDVLRSIDRALPRTESWSEDVVLWGDEGGNRIHAVLEGGKVAEITARIDLRRPSGAFVEQVIAIARDCDAHLSTPDGHELPAEKSRLLEAMRNSESFRFVSDPRRFFDGSPVEG